LIRKCFLWDVHAGLADIVIDQFFVFREPKISFHQVLLEIIRDDKFRSRYCL
jgi:hypothetical protein